MPSKLKFVVRARRESVAPSLLPVFVLRTDNWDDYGHQVQFHLSYHDAKSTITHLGPVKILQKKSKDGEPVLLASATDLEDSFSELGAEYISLGQEDDYYTNLHTLLGDQSSDVLVALRDIAWRPALATDFEPTSAFRNAMMRENGAHRARRFGRAWAVGEPANEEPAFTYIGSIEGADANVEASFAFKRKDPVPGRIVGIIGRNAVGKTRFLASLGADLAQISRTSAEKLIEREERFPDGRPLFTRIIAISYSAFDRFKRPLPDSSSSYVYCGIRNDKGGLSRAYLNETYRRNQERIRERGLQDDWIEYAQTILGDLSEQLMSNLKAEIDSPTTTTDDQALSLLSSGQSILAHFVTALLAWIQPNSLVLFDEPETHLHPNAVASLFLVLSEILGKFDSYAVVATHSPVVIQEIPAKRVLVFEREQNLTVAHPLLLESFGESVTELTRHVFETIEVESVYRRTLKRLAKSESAEDVLARFDQGLSLSAEAYLLAQYGKKEGKNK
ncbi:AAA domain-containing protein, putative AbiEii toxin, Type IV TA system [Pseudomonas peli]|uniref:AAA domain-containing protein, putative AbiEii toxin, Type IV TA system n=1 Tax=Pseudomonas peli TaxID=592361 RepID=A0AB37ZA83_9PSED|nr:AAA family ATPase [Pseudomonas peli]NMZ70689.1 AAA family ATPase [Pseudomonas peli]SCW72029.1 AAA domain-containing protein, putative AbiEii toxin, Type IV TA system [Pseudomonas peli]